MKFEGISRAGVCVNIKCSKPRWAKGLCRNHYEQIARPKWKRESAAAARKKEKPMTAGEKLTYDPAGLWEFVKTELKITGSKIDFESLPRK